MKFSLEACRINKNMSLQYVSDEIGVTLATIRNWEKGKTLIPHYYLMKMLDLYEVTLDCVRVPQKM